MCDVCKCRWAKPTRPNYLHGSFMGNLCLECSIWFRDFIVSLNGEVK